MIGERERLHGADRMSLVFPFRRKYPNLKRYWWHRLAVVMFWTLVVGTILGVWIAANGSELTDYQACLRLEPPITAGCETYLPHSKANFVIGLIAGVLSSYVLQTLY